MTPIHVLRFYTLAGLMFHLKTVAPFNQIMFHKTLLFNAHRPTAWNLLAKQFLIIPCKLRQRKRPCTRIANSQLLAKSLQKKLRKCEEILFNTSIRLNKIISLVASFAPFVEFT